MPEKNREEKRTPGYLKLCYAAVAICILLAGLCFSARRQDENAFQKRYDENALNIRALSAELESLQAYEPDNVEIVRSHIYSAREKGEAMAELQMRYLSVTLPGDTEESVNAYMDTLYAIKDEMMEYLEVGASGMGMWFGELTHPGEFTWTFETTYDFAGNSVPCVWTCRDSSGKLVAYATSTYNAMTEKFSAVNNQLTLRGYMWQGIDNVTMSPDDYNQDTGGPLTDEDIGSILGGLITVPAGEDMSQDDGAGESVDGTQTSGDSGDAGDASGTEDGQDHTDGGQEPDDAGTGSDGFQWQGTDGSPSEDQPDTAQDGFQWEGGE